MIARLWKFVHTQSINRFFIQPYLLLFNLDHIPRDSLNPYIVYLLLFLNSLFITDMT